MTCPHCSYNPDQCAYAMAKLLERIVTDGYVREERAEELLERARNMQHGRAFLTDAELQEQEELQALKDFIE